MHTKIIIHFELMGSVNKIFEPINKVLNAIRMSHLWLHHRIFRGDNFQSDKKEDLEQITSPWPFFLIAFVLHYVFLVAVSFALHHLALVAVLPINSLNFFSIGVVVRYLLVYEILHFFTHKKNNKFDKFISCKFIKIPVLGPIVANLRAEQVEHHKKHHNDVKINFAVTPPYTLDNIGNTRAVT